MDYMDLCYEARNFCSLKKLYLLLNKKNIELPKRSIYTADKEPKSRLSKDDISELLDYSALPGKSFAPASKKRQKPLVVLPDDPPIQKINSWGDLNIPISVYRVFDIIDFILASLYCIFESNFVIGKCNYCDNLFVTHNRRQSYCPKLDPANNNKNCREEAKLKRQLENDNRPNLKMEKSLRTMLIHKTGGHDDEYRSFLNKSSEYRHRIKAGESTNEEHIELLKTFYARKYKE